MTRQGMFQPLVSATVLAGGFMGVWGLAALWGVEVVGHVARQPIPVERLIFLPDGTPRVEVKEQDPESHRLRRYRDLQGNPVAMPEADNHRCLRNAGLPATLPGQVGNDDVPWIERVRSFADGREPATYWYFVSDGRPNGTGYFVGYDSQSRSCVGYLGTGGFREGLPPTEEHFPFGGLTSGCYQRLLCAQGEHGTLHPANEPLRQVPRGYIPEWVVYVVGWDHKIYQADLRSHGVRVVLDEPRLRSAALVADVPDPEQGLSYRLAVRTDDQVLVLDGQARVLKRYPLPEPLRGRDITFAETSRGEAILYWHSPFDELAAEFDYRIYRVAPDGRCWEAEVSLLSPSMRWTQTFAGLVVPAPLVLDGLVAFVRTQSLLDEGLEAAYPEALIRALMEFRLALVSAQLLAALLAILCYRRQVRYGASSLERVVWPLFVLALGLPGWVGYRFGRSWPVLEPCPTCTAGVPRDRESCTHCGGEFPRPALKGTEVFA